MIKCPHCGSTAQVKSNSNLKRGIINPDNLIEGFYCGCGCIWEQEYERNEQGHWQYLSTFINYTPEQK